METYTKPRLIKEVVCARCGIVFGITEDYQQDRLNDHEGFCCPAGHRNVYNGKSEADRLRDELARAKRQSEYLEARADRNYKLAEQEIRRSAAARGVATRIKNRVKNGVCPYCNRTFKQLAAHMKENHCCEKQEATHATDN